MTLLRSIWSTPFELSEISFINILHENKVCRKRRGEILMPASLEQCGGMLACTRTVDTEEKNVFGVNICLCGRENSGK